MPDLSKSVPPRPPGFCIGCPERPIFAAMKLVQQETGKLQISADIGCHLFAALPPFEIGGATMGYGLGPAANAAFDGGGARRAVSSIGDGGFWHNGLSSRFGAFGSKRGVPGRLRVRSGPGAQLPKRTGEIRRRQDEPSASSAKLR